MSNKPDPWTIAYECSRSRCDLGEIARNLREKLMAEEGSSDYLEGLELFKALKSQLDIQKFIILLKALLTKELVSKIMEEVTCDKVVEYFKKSPDRGYSLLTILEIYPLLGRIDHLKGIIVCIMDKVYEHRLNDGQRLEIIRALIHGPIASLPLKELGDILKRFGEKLNDKVVLQASTDLLVMIAQNYPSKSFSEYPEIAESIGSLLRGVAEKTLLLVEDDPDLALEVYHQISLFKTLISNICRELGSMELCNRVWRSAGETIEEMYRLIGNLEIMMTTPINDYTSG